MEELKCPSGVVFDQHNLAIIKGLAEAGTVRWSDQPFTLKSGIKSNVYVFGREDLTDNWGLLDLIGREVYRKSRIAQADKERRLCFIGIPTAGTAIAAAAARFPHLGRPMSFRVMREGQKDYGAHKGKWVNGDYNPELDYESVDNVITDGKSKFEAIERLKEAGYPVEQMFHLTLIDRQQGGIQRLEKAGYKTLVVYNLLDLVYAFGELGLWPKDRVEAVEKEIAAHQLA